MDKIQLMQVLPRVFEEKTDVQSDIWMKNVTFEKGKKYLIEAASGTGKSSLCSFVYGYRKDYSGKILFDDEDVANYNVSQWVELRKRSVSMLFQELRLFPELTAFENIRLKNDLTGFRTTAEIEQRLEQLGIADKRDQLIGKMSFGQQQRVAFVRALSQPADFLFMDEPVSHLDKSNGKILADILDEECQKRGLGIIVTSIGHHIEMDYNRVLKL